MNILIFIAVVIGLYAVLGWVDYVFFLYLCGRHGVGFKIDIIDKMGHKMYTYGFPGIWYYKHLISKI